MNNSNKFEDFDNCNDLDDSDFLEEIKEEQAQARLEEKGDSFARALVFGALLGLAFRFLF